MTELTAAGRICFSKDTDDGNGSHGDQHTLALLERSTQQASPFTFELNVPWFVAVIFGPLRRDGPSIRPTGRHEQPEGTEEGETNHCKKAACSKLLAVKDAPKGSLTFSSPGAIPWHVTILTALRANRLPVRLAGAPA